MILLLLGQLALADACDEMLAPVDDSVSVAWVSPVRKTVGNKTWLEVVATRDLRAWLQDEPNAGVGRLLQRLGMRKKSADPRRRYKITIFDARSADLCRPVEGADESAPLSGLLPCSSGVGRATRLYSGCGYTTDHRDDSRGVDVYRARWEDLAVRGFCVVPAERFLSAPAD